MVAPPETVNVGWSRSSLTIVVLFSAAVAVRHLVAYSVLSSVSLCQVDAGAIFTQPTLTTLLLDFAAKFLLH